MTGTLLLSVLLLLLNAFFVGAEFAVIAARRSQVEPLAETGRREQVSGGAGINSAQTVNHRT